MVMKKKMKKKGMARGGENEKEGYGKRWRKDANG